ARFERLPNLTQEFHVGGMLKVTNRAAQKQHQQLLALPAARGYFQQSIKVLALKAQDADRLNVTQFTLTHGKSGLRDFNGAIGNMLMTAQGFEHPARFLAAAAAQFGYRGWRRESGYDGF